MSESGGRRSGPIPEEQLGTIPRDAYLGFRVDGQTVGLPATGEPLLALGDSDWFLEPGTYELRLKIVFPSSGGSSWTGAFELPPVVLTVP